MSQADETAASTFTCQHCGGDYFTGIRYYNRRLCEDCLWASRPYDHVWNGQRVTHYLNHGSEWCSAPATESGHWILCAGAVVTGASEGSE